MFSSREGPQPFQVWSFTDGRHPALEHTDTHRWKLLVNSVFSLVISLITQPKPPRVINTTLVFGNRPYYSGLMTTKSDLPQFS